MERRANELLGRIGVHLDVTRPMRALSTAQEQLVQIATPPSEPGAKNSRLRTNRQVPSLLRMRKIFLSSSNS